MDEIAKIKSKLKKDPSYLEAYKTWREAINKLKKPDEALKDYQNAIEKNLNTSDAYNDFGILLYDLGKNKEAIEQYKKAIEVDPKYELAYGNWRKAIKNLEQPEKALKDYQKAIENNLDTADSYFDFGYLLFDISKYSEAIDQYNKAIEQYEKFDPKNSNLALLYLNKGVALDRLFGYKKAIEQYKKAIEQYEKLNYKDSGYALAYKNWGLALAYQGKNEEAIEKYKEAVELYKKLDDKDPNYPYTYTNWREAIKKLPEPDKELEEYLKTIEKNLDTADEYNNYGILLLDLKRYKEAIEQYKKATEIDSNYVFAYYNWGVALASLGKFEEAIEQYKKAIELYEKTDKEDKATAYNAWGSALANQGKNEEAIKKYKEAIKYNKENKTVYLDLGVAFEKLGKFEESYTQYKKANKLYEKTDKESTSYALSFYDLGVALANLGKFEEAIEQYKKAIELYEKTDKEDPFYANAHFGQGFALSKVGLYKEAIDCYDKSAQIDKTEFRAYSIHNIANIYQNQGNYKEANLKWAEACVAYEKRSDEELKNKNAGFFQYYGNIYQFSALKDLDLAGDIYLKGLEIDKVNTNILTNLVEVFIGKRNEISETFCVDKDDECSKTKQYSKAKGYFNKAELILKNCLKKETDKEKKVDCYIGLGNLYLAIENLKEAQKYFKEALTIIESLENLSEYKKNLQDENLKNILVYLGKIHIQRRSYKKAVVNFRDALSFEPDNLDMRSNLAEAYLKADSIENAEREYREILDIAPHHMDSLIGIAQTYITMAEKANERDDFGFAEEILLSAGFYYREIIKLIQDKSFFSNLYSEVKKQTDIGIDENVPKVSKVLNVDEKSAVYYSKGYGEVMLYEIQKKQNPKLLVSALADFRKVKEGTTNYFKAKRAIKKINEKLNPPQGIVDIWGPRIVLYFSVIVFTIAQLSLYKKAIAIPTIKLGTVYYGLITFGSLLFIIVCLYIQDMTKQLNPPQWVVDIWGSRIVLLFSIIVFIFAQMNYYNKAISIPIITIDPVYYGFMTFGSLLFMVVGLYIQQITKLKVGNLELEKSTIDQISTSTSLGITGNVSR